MKKIIEKLLRRFGFVPIRELEYSEKQVTSLINHIEKGRRFEIIKSNSTLTDNRSYDETVLIIDGENIIVGNCKLKNNSSIFITSRSENVQIENIEIVTTVDLGDGWKMEYEKPMK